MERNEYQQELEDRIPRDLQPGMSTWDRNDPRGFPCDPPNRNQEAADLAASIRRRIALNPNGEDNPMLLEAAMMIESLWLQADMFRHGRNRLRWQLNELTKLIDALDNSGRKEVKDATA